jgi:alkylation response protein AidB-like acyl-CoA dehydrogenase
VTTPPGWRETYRRWAETGWNAVGAPSEWGGQNLPTLVQMALTEIWNGANPAFGVGPMLSPGAVQALLAHADDGLKQRFLPEIVAGRSMVTMNLTEPQAGSDLGAVKARAEPAADGSYRIFGQKIFITYGDHDLTENIVHLVLARLPDAPAGSHGISLFVVPKLLDDGSRNDIAVAGLEHKLGLHGSPTCTMVYGEAGRGATGWLVGAPHRGLACMFTMMNHARLSVGMQGVGIADRACRLATAYARERRQGRAPDATGNGMSPIIAHPDVRRELIRMTTLTAAARAIAYACAEAIDMSQAGGDAERQAWSERASLLTPVAKAFATDTAIAVASAGIQVHGGAGYIEETGAAQLLRDARIFAIYEGTNGIQAIDLVTRKLGLGDGHPFAAVLDGIDAAAERISAANHADFGRTAMALRRARDDLATAAAFLTESLAAGRRAAALSGATPFLRLFGLAFGGALLANGASGAHDGTAGRATALARFHAETLLAETPALAAIVVEGSDALAAAARVLLPQGPAA